MKFPVSFTRRVGGSGSVVVLGADAVPTAAPTGQDFILAAPVSNTNGWPTHRIAVIYAGPASALELPADLYMWESTIGGWFKLNQAKRILVPNQVNFFDVVGITPSSPIGSDLAGSNPGGLVLALVVATVAGTPDGTYSFAMAPDLTTIGEDLPDQSGVGRRGYACVLNDATDATSLPKGPCRAIRANAAGDVKFIPTDNLDADTLTWTVAAGEIIQMSVRRVFSTGTTVAAGNLTAIY